MRSMVKPTAQKLVIAGVLLAASFGSAVVVYRLFDAVALASALFFPLRLYLATHPLLREPGYQDVMYGGCRVPNCDLVGVAITVVVSGVVYYVVAAMIVRFRTGR